MTGVVEQDAGISITGFPQTRVAHCKAHGFTDETAVSTVAKGISAVTYD